MKKILLTTTLIVFVFSMIQAQFTFQVSPGLQLNGASFGYKISKLTPYAGFQYLGFKSYEEYERHEEYYDEYMDEMYVYDYARKTTIRGKAFMPFLGVKYNFIEANSLRAFINATVYKPILGLSVVEEINGVNDDEIQDEIDEVLDGFSLGGAELSFGAEYFFDEQFSLSGEFGYRMAMYTYAYENIDDDSDYYEQYYETTKDELDLTLNNTYTKISFNFYFNKKEKSE